MIFSSTLITSDEEELPSDLKIKEFKFSNLKDDELDLFKNKYLTVKNQLKAENVRVCF